MFRAGRSRGPFHKNRRPQGTGGTPTPTPTFTPVVARSVPTGTTYNVNTGMSSAAIGTIYYAALPGDMVAFAAGTYDQNAIFNLGWTRPGVIVGAQSVGLSTADPFGSGRGIPHPARFTRNVVFLMKSGMGGTTSTISAAATGHVIQDVKFIIDNANLWPADNAQWTSTCASAAPSGAWGVIKLSTALDGIQIKYCECSMGWGTAGTQFDPTVKYLDYNSPALYNNGGGSVNAIISGSPDAVPGWGDATWVSYNRVYTAPYFIYGAGRVGAGIVIAENYVHDMGHGINSILPASGVCNIQQNWFERIYHDYGTITSVSATWPSSLLINQNVFIDPMSNILDSTAPHQDTDQVAAAPASVSGLKAFGMRAARNLLMMSNAATRGNTQYHFWQLSGGHYTTNDIIGVAPKLRENIGVMSGTSHATDLGVSEDIYYRGNEIWHPDSLSNGTSPVSTTLTADSQGGSISFARTNKSLYADNMLESGLTATFPITVNNLNSIVMGPRGSRLIAENTIVTGNTAVWPTTPYAAFQYRKKQVAYSTLGTQQSTIEDFLLGPLNWTGERPFAGFVDSLGNTAGNTVTSNPAWVHGGNPGDLLSFVPAAGVTWRTVSTADRTTPVQGNSTSTRNVTVDSEYIIQDFTAPTQGTSTTVNSTLGGVTMPWTVGSASTALYPVVLLDIATPDIFRIVASSSIDTVDGTTGTMALMGFKLAAAPGATMTIYSSARLSVTILTTGIMRVNLANTAGTTFARLETSASICDNVSHDLLLSWDTSDTTQATGRSFYKDGLTASNSAATWPASATNVGYASTLTNTTFGAPSGQDLTIGAFYLMPNTRVDITVPANRDKFGAGQMLHDGSGPTGVQAAILLTGTAGQTGGWNDAAGINWGARGKYIKVGSASATDVSGSPW